MEERELLREYVERGTESAFAELVRRHVDLVHSTARRLVVDSDLANDVCQSVFLLLARKASSIRKTDALAGWLYRATRFEAASLVRREQRRRAREAEAMRRSELNQDTAPAWERIVPMLEEAMAQLRPQDQNAVLLRFFENRALAEVGHTLGLTEEAARKRVSRSIDQLQAWFRKRGMGVSAASLASLLAANAVEAAPAGLAASLATTALAGSATTVASAGLLTTLTPALLMTKTTGTILAVLVLGAVLTPVLLNRSSAKTSAQTSTPKAVRATAAEQTPSAAAPRPAIQTTATAATGQSLLERVSSLPPLTSSQVEAYVQSNNRNAESLLAAYRVTTNISYLTEAARSFPADPDVQYAIVASHTAPDVQRQWIDAYKGSSPDNALPWYFSALEHYRTRDPKRAANDLLEASRKTVFRAELAPTLQALQEMHLSAGRAADEARLASFMSAALPPHLLPMRELATEMQRSIGELRQGGNAAAADQLAGAGLVLGSHLSAGAGSQTLINQLVGIAIEQKFLQQLEPAAATDPFGRSVSEVKATIENHRNALKQHSKTVSALLPRLDDTELATYMERVKLYGEEAALVWIEAKHASR